MTCVHKEEKWTIKKKMNLGEEWENSQLSQMLLLFKIAVKRKF